MSFYKNGGISVKCTFIYIYSIPGSVIENLLVFNFVTLTSSIRKFNNNYLLFILYILKAYNGIKTNLFITTIKTSNYQDFRWKEGLIWTVYNQFRSTSFNICIQFFFDRNIYRIYKYLVAFHLFLHIFTIIFQLYKPNRNHARFFHNQSVKLKT